MHTGTLARWSARLFGVASLLGLSGCGTNVGELLYQSASATGRTLLDILLTDLADTLVGSSEQAEVSDQDQAEAPEGDNGNGDAEAVNGAALEELSGDAAAGETLYVSSNCATCHCADAVGDCALSAPSLIGSDTETLGGFLRGAETHSGGTLDLSDQDIVDLETYLGANGG